MLTFQSSSYVAKPMGTRCCQSSLFGGTTRMLMKTGCTARRVLYITAQNVRSSVVFAVVTKICSTGFRDVFTPSARRARAAPHRSKRPTDGITSSEGQDPGFQYQMGLLAPELLE